MQIERPTLTGWFVLLIALGLTWWVYHPGLHGDFLFDDFANMPALGATGPVTHWATFFRYITSGTADPTGRPLTLLTFLLDGHDWPTAAYPFKRTNVLLHLVNGVLLTLLLVQLTGRTFANQIQRNRSRAVLACVVAATLWLIHPLFVSTVLYVVQREAMLPLTCVLTGLLLWLYGRDALMRGRVNSGIAWMAIGLVGCSALGVLSKANGALLPIYALLIEYILLSPRLHAAGSNDAITIETSSARNRCIYRQVFALLAWLPALAIIGYLIYAGISGAVVGVGRPWTIGQRLLTEPRILFDYLDLLWLPRPFTPGLFNDQIIPSTSLWAPATTVLSLLGVIGLLVLAWRLRHRHPAAAFAILFFFAGHLLESTTIPLELYYEHRNYIPAIFMFWPLSLWLCNVGRSHMVSYSRLKLSFALILIAGLAVMTHARADLWGNSQQQALLWAKLNPASPRAQANAANYEMAMGQPQAAKLRLEAVLHEHPADPQIALNILSANCQLGGMTASDLRLAENTLRYLSKGESVIFHWLGNAIQSSKTGSCPGISSHAVSSMLDAAEQNPRLNRVTGRMQDIDHLRGQLALSLHQPAQALAWFDKGLALRPNPQMAFEQAAMLGSAGYPAEGLRHLSAFESSGHIEPPQNFGMPRIHAWVLRRQNYWSNEMVHLRATLQGDLEHNNRAMQNGT
jgi:protein O-mannosyl-transferase